MYDHTTEPATGTDARIKNLNLQKDMIFMNSSIFGRNDKPKRRPTRLAEVNVNDIVVPPKYTFPFKYYFSPPDRELSWLLDEGRLDDAVVYFLKELGPSFAHRCLSSCGKKTQMPSSVAFGKSREFGSTRDQTVESASELRT
jgi:hypothetical protein